MTILSLLRPIFSRERDTVLEMKRENFTLDSDMLYIYFIGNERPQTKVFFLVSNGGVGRIAKKRDRRVGKNFVAGSMQ